MNTSGIKSLSTWIFIVALAILSSGCNKETPQRPNILFAIADDWSYPHAGAYGDPVVQTPAFDRLAREGVLCNHAYVSAPSCTPSRNAILTGQFHWRLGAGASLWSTLDPDHPVYPLILEDAGYYVGFWRKSWGPGKLDGWERHPAGQHYRGFEEFLNKRPDNTPFCFWLGASDPHRPYKAGTGVQSGMDIDRIRLFECFPDHPQVRSDVADYYFEVQRFDSDVATAIRLLEKTGELDNTIIVMTGDNGMPFPRSKSNLYDSGTRVPLAIRWGSGIRKPGRTIDDFISLCDLAPTFLAAAGIEIPEVMTGMSLMGLLESSREGIMDKRNRSFVLYGKERHVPCQEEVMDGYPSRAIRNHDFLYIRNFKPDLWPSGTPDYMNAAIPGSWLGDCDNGPSKSYITDNKNKDDMHRYYWKLSFGKRPAEELYDFIHDPGQLNNLADDPSYQEIKESLSSKLSEQLALTKDPRMTGNEDELEGHPYYGGAPKHPDYITDTDD